MKRAVLLSLALGALTGSAVAQDHTMMNHTMSMAAMPDDARQPVTFPPMMRQRILANMRDHLEAMSGILAALGAGDYAKAGRIADARLGVNSPAAAGCKAGGDNVGKPQMSSPMDMEQMMAQYMPTGMRQAGFSMHQAASDFAAEAAKAAGSGDGKPALSALARVTQGCTACHSAYRVQ